MTLFRGRAGAEAAQGHRHHGVRRRDHPDDDIAALKKQGVEQIFTPGTPLQEIVDLAAQAIPAGPAKPAFTPEHDGAGDLVGHACLRA